MVRRVGESGQRFGRETLVRRMRGAVCMVQVMCKWRAQGPRAMAAVHEGPEFVGGAAEAARWGP